MAPILIIVAVAIDIIQFLLSLAVFGLLLAPLVSLLATVVFAIVLVHNGVPIGRHVGRVLGTIGGELVPAVDIIPFWSLLAIRIVIAERARRAAEYQAKLGRRRR